MAVAAEVVVTEEADDDYVVGYSAIEVGDEAYAGVASAGVVG